MKVHGVLGCLLAGALVATSACGEKDDKKDPTSEVNDQNDDGGDDGEDDDEEDDDGDNGAGGDVPTALADSTNPGAALSDIDAAMRSAGALAITSLNLAGVPNDYCNGSGGPVAGGTDMTSNAESYAAALGFCQATHNSQSPDNVRGAMYLSGSVACSMGLADMFKNLEAAGDKNEDTIDISISTPCWGDAEEAAAMVTDMGSDTVAGMAVSVELLAESSPYQFKVGMTFPGDSEPTYMYVASKDGIRAAMFDGWAVTMNAKDLTKVKINYEGATQPDSGGYTRTRILMKGAMGTDGKFTKVDALQGFVATGNSNGELSYISTFSGNLTAGILGASYSDNMGAIDNDGAGFCYLPTNEEAACAEQTFIAGSAALGQALVDATVEAGDAINANASALMDFDAIDPSDVNVLE